MTASRLLHLIPLSAAILLLGGCSGIQSALSPEGPEASRVHVLMWVLTIGSAVIFLGVAAIAAVAILGNPRWRARLGNDKVIIGGGLVFPVITLTALLIYGFLVMRAQSTLAGAHDAVRIAVVGERWWWRIVYTKHDGTRFESANEIRIPANKPVELALTTADVIHSLWIPKLAGKLDMIPGRTNVLRLSADRPGISRGQCAEYCGGAHAMMSLFVVAMNQSDYDAWFEKEAKVAEAPENEDEQQGQRLFMSYGCGACHAVRGTDAQGTIGPDLTHIGSRRSLAAATLPNSQIAIARWIKDNQHIKPDNLMPPYRIFSDRELTALSAYLAGLE